ncbi:Histidinol dehydrogenase [Nocardia amikacinitolerans]|nr:Histidinol dehydrogenase [Nocardia amikacinitolerans]
MRPGVFLGQRSLPVDRAGAYVPRGRYPLVASAHMTVVTAKVAGVEHVTASVRAIVGPLVARGADRLLRATSEKFT